MLDFELNTTMRDTIQEKLDDIQRLDVTESSYKAAAEATVQLYKARAEVDKFEKELELEQQKLEVEKLKVAALLQNQSKEQKHKKRELIVSTVLGVIGIAVPAATYWAAYNQGLKFEETGSVTSGFFKNLIGKLRPSK